MQKSDSELLAVKARQAAYEPYLCSRLALRDAQPHIWSLLCFNNELQRIPQVTSEEMIRLIRVAWWREAVEEIYAGTSPRRHEVVQPLAEAIATYDVPQTLLMSIIEGHQNRALEGVPEEEAAYTAQLRTVEGALWRGIALCSGVVPEECGIAVEKVGALYAEQSALRGIVKGLEIGAVSLPAARLDRHKVSVARLQLEGAEALSSLWHETRAHLGHMIEGIQPEVELLPPPVRALFALCRHQQAWLSAGPSRLLHPAVLGVRMRSYAFFAWCAMQKNRGKRRS